MKRPKSNRIGEGLSEEELQTMAADAREGVRELLGMLTMIHVSKISSPSASQIKAVQKYEPYRGANLMGVRGALVAGEVRIGPIATDVAEEEVIPALVAVGLTPRIASLSTDDERQFWSWEVQ